MYDVFDGDPCEPEALRCACCRFEDDSAFFLAGFACGGAKEGLFGSVTCQHKKADGTVELIHYTRTK
jgi:hypothetical protein